MQMVRVFDKHVVLGETKTTVDVSFILIMPIIIIVINDKIIRFATGPPFRIHF